MRKRGPHKLISSEVVYKNPWITVHEDKIIRPNGKEGLYGVIEYAPGAVVVALTPNNEVYLVKEYLYAIGESRFCLPGGGIEEGEKPVDSAKKELREEAGVEASEWTDMGVVHPYPMVVNGVQHMLLATGARAVGSSEEEFSVARVPFNKALDMVMNGEITQAVSCAAILKAKAYLETS